jgi:hypothetical protein
MPGNVGAFGAVNPEPPVAPQSGGNVGAFGIAPPPDAETQVAPQPTGPKPLPKGASGFDPFGNPYFGEGLPAILKKWQYNFTKDIKPVDDSEWQALKERWASLNEQQKKLNEQGAAPGQNVEQQGQLSQEAGSLIAGTVSTAVRAGSAEGSVLAPVLKAVSASVTAIGELFSIPAQKAEQAAGAVRGFAEAAQQVDSVLPRLEGSSFEEGLAVTPIGLAYDVVRLALSSSENKWSVEGKAIEEGWQAGRIYYSQALDASLKEKFLQEYRAGGDPALIAMKMQNPLAELGGQLLFDPLNLVGAFGKAAKTAKELNVTQEAVTGSGLLKLEKGAQALEEMGKAQDSTAALKSLNTLYEAQKEAVATVRGESKLLNVTYTADSLTTSSRQNAVISKGKELLGNMALVLKQQGYSADGVAEAILYGVRSVADNEMEMKKGLAGLAHLPNAHMWLGDDYLETFTVMKNMMANSEGVIADARLRPLLKAKNTAEFAEAAAKLMLGAAKTSFKDVNELKAAAALVGKSAKGAGEVGEETIRLAKQYEELPNHVKILNNIDTKLSKSIKNPVNKVLSPAYFNLQGGVATKNVLANNELIFLDKGPGAWFKEGKYWTTENVVEFIKDVNGGELPTSTHGFTSFVQAGTGKEAKIGATEIRAAQGIVEKAKTIAKGFKEQGFGLLMNVGEEDASIRVVGASIRDTFKKMIPKALPDLRAEIEAGSISQGQVDKFARLLYQENGNVDRAVSKFRDFYKTGLVEEWRNLDFVTDFQRNALEHMDLWKDIENLAHDGAASQADVEKVFEKLGKVVSDRAGTAVRDTVGLSLDHPGAETWGDLMKAVEDGHLNPNDQETFTAIMESAEQARLEYQTLLDDVALKAQTALSQEGKVAKAQKIGAEMNRVRQTLREAMPATTKATHGLTQDAWRWSDAINAEKKLDAPKLVEYWNKAGLTGTPPLDLNKGSLLKELWKQRFDNVTQTWNSSFDAIVGESETVLEQMSKVVDATELKSMATRTRTVSQQAQALRSATFDGKALRIKPVEDVAYIAKQYGVKTEEILNAINNKLPEGAQAFAKIEDMPTPQIMDVLEQVRQEKGLPEIKGVAVPPPHPLGSEPTAARAWNESAKGARYTLDTIKNNILDLWGHSNKERVADADMEAVLQKIIEHTRPKMAETRAVALRIAEEQRNFTLLNYGAKTYGDVGKSYVLPYHFFYTRSYQNWVRRIATNPEIVAGYAKYKTALERQNKDLPDWYKQQLNVNPFTDSEQTKGKEFLGIPLDHPLYINLEASLNPLYGLTGTDFNDPAKRTNWATATLDDLGKFGPTLWAPIQLGVAATLYAQGNTDAASRWGGRLIPETAQVKAVTSLFGHPVELDPNVQLFSGNGLLDFNAKDSYERGRMGYAAAQMLKEGMINPDTNAPYTPEELQSQFQQQSGAGWDQAYQLAIQSRAASSISSYFLGVGFKPRSSNDVTVEQMYSDLNKLYANSDFMSSEQFKTEYEKLRSNYPDGMFDTVLLSRKGGEKRDAAYAYNVLGRLPPGEMSDVFKAIGISQKDVSKFYDTKGFTSTSVTFTKTEKDRFMAAIVDMGAMLKIPDSAIRSEWNDARNEYSQAYKGVQAKLGNDIWDKVSHWYDLKDDNPDAADAFKTQHPEIMQALQMKSEAVISSPLLSAYYGGIDTIEAYISGKVRQQLADKYGSEIYDTQTGYFNATSPRAYLAAHPELKAFWADKKKLETEGDKTFFQMAQNLPNPTPAQIQAGYVPQSGVQETILNALQPQTQIPPWQELSQQMPDWLKAEVQKYVEDATPLSKRGNNEMDYLAQQLGFYNAKDMLRTAALSLKQSGGETLAEKPQNVSGNVGAFAIP